MFIHGRRDTRPHGFWQGYNIACTSHEPFIASSLSPTYTLSTDIRSGGQEHYAHHSKHTHTPHKHTKWKGLHATSTESMREAWGRGRRAKWPQKGEKKSQHETHRPHRESGSGKQKRRWKERMVEKNNSHTIPTLILLFVMRSCCRETLQLW